MQGRDVRLRSRKSRLSGSEIILMLLMADSEKLPSHKRNRRTRGNPDHHKMLTKPPVN